MGEAVDRLIALSRVHGYTRMVDGKPVHVEGYFRGGERAKSHPGWPQPKPFAPTLRASYPSQKERDTAYEYSGDGNYDLNQALRDGQPLTREQQDMFDTLKGLGERTRLAKPVTLYREVGPAPKDGKDFIPAVGKTFTDPAFISTEHTRNYTAHTDILSGRHNRNLDIDAPAGTPVIDMSHATGWETGEYEVVLLPGTKFEVVSRSEDDMTIHLRVVPEG